MIILRHNLNYPLSFWYLIWHHRICVVYRYQKYSSMTGMAKVRLLYGVHGSSICGKHGIFAKAVDFKSPLKDKISDASTALRIGRLSAWFRRNIETSAINLHTGKYKEFIIIFHAANHWHISIEHKYAFETSGLSSGWDTMSHAFMRNISSD